MTESATIAGVVLLHGPGRTGGRVYHEALGWDGHDGGFALDGEIVAAGRAVDGADPGWIPIVTATEPDRLLAAATTHGASTTGAGPYTVVTDPRGARFAVPANDFGPLPPYSPLESTPGRFCWAQLNTGEPGAAGAFYSAVFGWDRMPSSNDKFTYEDFERAGESYAGMMQIDERSGLDVPEVWQVYFRAADVVGTVRAATEAGAAVVVPPTVLVDVTFAVLRDADGHLFGVERFAEPS